MQEESPRKINNLYHSNTCHTLEEIQVAINKTRCFTGSSDNSGAHATESGASGNNARCFMVGSLQHIATKLPHRYHLPNNNINPIITIYNFDMRSGIWGDRSSIGADQNENLLISKFLFLSNNFEMKSGI